MITTSTQLRTLAPTPSQVPGPFYPGDEAFVPRRDLTREGLASGQEILVRGDVRDERGRPVPGALVKLWQACASGRYNDPRDTNPAPLDPLFSYWGLCVTGADGRYEFRTVIPGEYKDTETWTRPPHLHLMVSAKGFPTLTTQMYFSGNPLNEKDLILEKTPREEWSRLIVPFWYAGRGVRVGEFRIVLGRD